MDYLSQNIGGQNIGVGSLSLLQGNLSNPGIEPRSPALQGDSLAAEPQSPISNAVLNDEISKTLVRKCKRIPIFMASISHHFVGLNYNKTKGKRRTELKRRWQSYHVLTWHGKTHTFSELGTESTDPSSSCSPSWWSMAVSWCCRLTVLMEQNKLRECRGNL